METKKLLLVEDDKGIAMGLEYSLRQEGFETVVCTAVCPALERLQTERVDLAILDLSLPDGTGYDVCRAIKAKNDGAAVIFLTARDDEGNIVMGLDMGADDYITKPFRLRELVSRIRSVLRRCGRTEAGNVYTFGSVQINTAQGKVYKGYTGGEIENMPPLENHERLTRESELAVGKLLRDEYESGRSIKDLAAEHDYSIARVRRYLSLVDTQLRPQGRTPALQHS